MRGLPSSGIVPEVTFDRLTTAVAPTRVRLMSCGKCQNGFWRQRNVCYVFVTKLSGEFSGLRVSRIGANGGDGKRAHAKAQGHGGFFSASQRSEGVGLTSASPCPLGCPADSLWRFAPLELRSNPTLGILRCKIYGGGGGIDFGFALPFGLSCGQSVALRAARTAFEPHPWDFALQNLWRRGWDSNPRSLSALRFSRPAQ